MDKSLTIEVTKSQARIVVAALESHAQDVLRKASGVMSHAGIDEVTENDLITRAQEYMDDARWSLQKADELARGAQLR